MFEVSPEILSAAMGLISSVALIGAKVLITALAVVAGFSLCRRAFRIVAREMDRPF